MCAGNTFDFEIAQKGELSATGGITVLVLAPKGVNPLLGVNQAPLFGGR
jgi:hypothetical protein